MGRRWGRLFCSGVIYSGGESNRPEAGYVHKLAIRPAYAGLGVGREMLRWAEEKTRNMGKKFLRLNCIAANSRIREYYEKVGFVRIRDVMGPRALATLYEKQL